MLRCDGLVREREMIVAFEEQGDEEKVTLVLDEGCRNLKAVKAIEWMWKKRVCSPE